VNILCLETTLWVLKKDIAHFR